MAKPFILTDESLNSYGFWLPMKGGDLNQFKKNPLMLWMHTRAWRGTNDEVLPIGRWDEIKVDGDKLVATPVFDDNDEFAMRIADKVDNDFIRMASVGITVIETSNDPKLLKPGQTRETVTKWRLREGSIVDMGANDNALAFYDVDGNPLNLSQADGECPVKLLDVQQLNTNQSQIQMEKLALLLGLAAAATQEQLTEKVQGLINTNTQLAADKEAAEKKLKELNDKLAADLKVKAKALLDAAIKDGRLNAESRPSWEKLFETDPATAEATLASIPVRKTAKEQIEGSPNLTDRAKYEKLSWDELDRAGKLSYVKEKHYDLFEEKFEAKFGKKPEAKK